MKLRDEGILFQSSNLLISQSQIDYNDGEKHMFRRSKAPALDELGVNLPPQTSFSGELRTNANVRVAGLVQGGVIDTTGNVVICATARVDCTIRAKGVSIQGSFRGVIRAERVEVLNGSLVEGKLHVKNYYTEQGANLRAAILPYEGEPVQPGRNFPTERSIPVIQGSGAL